MDTPLAYEEAVIRSRSILFVIPILAAGAAIVSWRALCLDQARAIRQSTDLAAASLRDEAGACVSSDKMIIKRIAARWALEGPPQRNNWEANAKHVVADSSTFQAISWISPDLHIRWIVPYKGNEAVVNLDLGKDRLRGASTRKAVRDRSPAVSQPMRLTKGEYGFVIHAPIYRSGRFGGLIAGAVRFDKLVKALQFSVTGKYAVRLTVLGNTIYSSSPGVLQGDEQWSRTTYLTEDGVRWVFTVTPTQATLGDFLSPLPAVSLGLGLLAAILLGGVIYFGCAAHEQAARALKESAQRAASEARFRAMSEASPLGVFVADGDGNLTYLNARLLTVSGYSEKDVIGRHLFFAVVEEELSDALAAWDRAIRDHVMFQSTLRVHTADGTCVWADVRAAAMRDGDQFLGYVGTIMDVTKKLEAERALHDSEARFRAAIGAIRDGFVLRNSQGEIILCNASAERIFGQSAERFVGRLVPVDEELLIHEDGSPFPYEDNPAVKALREGKEQTDVVVGIKRDHGETTWVSLSAAPLFRSGESRPSSVVTTFADITERMWFEKLIAGQIASLNDAHQQLQIHQQELAEANRRLESLAITDGLTGLKNHRAFHERLAEEYERAKRNGTPLSVLLLDVDNFKLFNDTHGHPEGDKALQRLAEVLKSISRSTDLTARYGGEEFAVILPGASAEGAVECAERMRAAIDRQARQEGGVTASFGAATLQPGLTASALVAQADAALYVSKAAGRNRVTHHDDVDEAKAA